MEMTLNNVDSHFNPTLILLENKWLNLNKMHKNGIRHRLRHEMRFGGDSIHLSALKLGHHISVKRVIASPYLKHSASAFNTLEKQLLLFSFFFYLFIYLF